MVTDSHITELPPTIQLGPRTRREIELRVRELEARLNPTARDRKERDRLRELLEGAGHNYTGGAALLTALVSGFVLGAGTSFWAGVSCMGSWQ
jgi:hypothetical protein